MFEIMLKENVEVTGMNELLASKKLDSYIQSIAFFAFGGRNVGHIATVPNLDISSFRVEGTELHYNPNYVIKKQEFEVTETLLLYLGLLKERL